MSSMGPPSSPNYFIGLPAVPGFVPPELFTNFPPNAPAFFSTCFRTRPARFVPKPAPQYAVRTNDPRDIYEKALFYRHEFPDFVDTIQSLPIAWEDLYTYFDPLEIWMEGAGFCFQVIHRIAAINIEKTRQMELFVIEWADANLNKLSTLAPHTPVTSVFNPEDYEFFDFDNLTHFEIATICNLLIRRCIVLQPQFHTMRQARLRAAEADKEAVSTSRRPNAKLQMQSSASPNSGTTETISLTTREFTGKSYGHRREGSYEKQNEMIRTSSGARAKGEPIYTYNPRKISQSEGMALSGPILTAFTPSRQIQDRAPLNENDPHRPGSKPATELTRQRKCSNTTRNQVYSTSRYDAASQLGAKMALPEAGNTYYNDISMAATQIEQGRSIYVRGFTENEFASDAVPMMMECCGEIDGYKPCLGKDYAFITFESPKGAMEAIKRFNGKSIGNGRELRVAHYRPKSEFDNFAKYNRYRGNSFEGNQRYMDGQSRDPLRSGELRRIYQSTVDGDRNTSTSETIQIPRKETNTPLKRHHMSWRYDFAVNKKDSEGGNTPKESKGHQPTNAGQSAKTLKSADANKFRRGSTPTASSKKGSFAVSEDLSVPEDDKHGTSFSSYSSSVSRKESIFDGRTVANCIEQATNNFGSSFDKREYFVTQGATLDSSKIRENDMTAGGSNKTGKCIATKKKKKFKICDLDIAATGSTDCQSVKIDRRLVLKDEIMDATPMKYRNTNDAYGDRTTVTSDKDGSFSNIPKSNSKIKNRSSPMHHSLYKRTTGETELVTRTPLKKLTKVSYGSTRKLAMENGSPVSSKQKHGKTNSNSSSFGIETRPKIYEGYTIDENEAAIKASENSHFEARNQTRSRFSKRNKSQIDLKENTHSSAVDAPTDVNILADLAHWPSLGDGKPRTRADQTNSGQSLATMVNPASNGSMETAKGHSMAAVISQKFKVVPVVPLIPRTLATTATRSVSGGSTKSDDTIVPVVNTTGTRLWPAVVKWAGKPPSTEVVESLLAPVDFSRPQ